MKPPIFMLSLGCPRNLVDSEVLAAKLIKKGFRVFYKLKKNSVAIVNTCGFIEDARNESIDAIMELAALKREGRILSLVVTGCLSQRYSKSLMGEIEEIDGLFGSGTFHEIPKYIERISKGGKAACILKKPRFLYNHRTGRSIMTPRHSVYAKIQEGCMNFCSFCVIPKIRGPFRSRSTESVLKEISFLKKNGAKEINLIGQDTTLYGIDRYKSFKLPVLLKKASNLMKSGWIRLLYTHPAHYTDRLIETLRDESAICKYLDLPIQHINDKILKKMNRKTRKRDIINLIEKLKKNIPNLAIRTSIMVGFPGESDKDFEELLNFIEETGFDRLGAFLYSREEGTKSYDFPNQIPHKEKCRRFDRIMKAQQGVSMKKNEAYLGKSLKVLIDEKDTSRPEQYIGRTEYDAPEVDGIVYVRSKKMLKPGDFANVKIEDTLEYDLVGTHESGE